MPMTSQDHSQGKHTHTPHTVRIRPRVADADRKRAARACWRCRDRKSRCILVRPREGVRETCQRCLKDGVKCIFGSITAGLESGQLTQHYEQTPTSDGSSGILRSRTRDITDPVISPNSSRTNIPSSPSKRLSEDARLLVKNSHQTHYVGEVSNGGFLSKVQDAVVADSPVDNPHDSMPSEYIQSLDANSTDTDLLRVALDSFPPKKVADFLVHTFFHTVEANYYYMDRVRFKERLAQCYADSPSEEELGELDASFVCLALMVFAMGSQFADLQAPSKLTPSVLVSKHGPGMVFYVKAKCLLSDVITACSLESIQVCFLIALFLLPSNTSDLSYVYHGIALKMAIAAGLHRKIVNTNLDPIVVQVRNRLWWSLYTSERRLTIILDRPESIREEDIDTPFPEFSDDLDLPHAYDNIGNLQASIRLTRIFNKVVRLGKSYDFTDPEIQTRLAEIKADLDDWQLNLPPRLQLSNLNPEGKSFRGSVHLHMTYNQIIIYIGRQALLRRIQKRLRHARNADNSTDIPPTNEPEETLSRACVTSAYKIVDLLRYLGESRKLARFSFTDMNCCSTAGIIVIIHEIIMRHPLYNSTISSILQSMKYMASGCQNAKHGLKLIQNLQKLTAAIKNKSPPTPGSAIVGERPEKSTDYEQWESWMAEAENWGAADGRRQSGSVTSRSEANIDGWQAVVGNLERTGNVTASGSYSGRMGQGLGSESVTYGEDAYAAFEMNNGFLYQSGWPDDLNLLGLGGFESLEFPAL